MIILWVHPDQILLRTYQDIRSGYKYLYLKGESEYLQDLSHHNESIYQDLIENFDYNDYNNITETSKYALMTAINLTDEEKRKYPGRNWKLIDGDHRASLLVYHGIIPFKVRILR